MTAMTRAHTDAGRQRALPDGEKVTRGHVLQSEVAVVGAHNELRKLAAHACIRVNGKCMIICGHVWLLGDDMDDANPVRRRCRSS